ncbi:MAG: ribonuclease P protein component [Deltaproteobacteria bacterium]|nr:ribonuclease P protein component [Deltaproteobacteria bacterium]
MAEGPDPSGRRAPSNTHAARPEANLAINGRFQRERRLLARRDFLRVQGRGTRVEGRHFVVVAHLASTAPSYRARLGLSVGRRVGGAVVRNRIKRLVREAFRRMPKLPAVDVVVIAKTSAAMLCSEGLRAIERELLPAMERAARRASETSR